MFFYFEQKGEELLEIQLNIVFIFTKNPCTFLLYKRSYIDM